MGIFKSNEERSFEKEMDAREPYNESDDETIQRETQRGQELRFPSTVTPEDFYQYKKFINLPESQAEHMTKIDKDVVFANIGGTKPTLEELRFQEGTIELFETEFVEEFKVPRRNPDGSLMRNSENQLILDTVVVFDEVFRGCLNFLKGQYKFDIVGSRAMGGQDRAAFLDISSSNRISKEFSKKKENTQRYWGSGGN